MRFTTTELGELETVYFAKPLIKRWRSNSNYSRPWSKRLSPKPARLRVAAAAMARLDLATAFALLAVERRYTRPRIDRSLTFQIEGGRHPVVADALAAAAEGDFVANDCDLTDEHGVSGF